ncbi:AAA family ATPase [Faecalicatena orotica]|uniref:AAA ATPase-like protein n=1 Tax=Faecalicatena orotica TaxID=1544 RepID=A0A2Y9BFP4_9FIRM|nr:AAA family ATPase [Faecalicatena orotica]PWJ29919.1 AAA ATPase-like protein [Faecalicatena orotica]SSA55645.1 AAA ATPase domain-containing protein [Faecalicatena orotica]
MDKQTVRIENIRIENFKNVKYGSLNLENKRKDYKSSILGLYGQNGSGKTALIDALQLLKFALSGKAIPSKYADYVNVDSEKATLTFQFLVCNEEGKYDIWYQFSLRKAEDNDSIDIEDSNAAQPNLRVEIYNEVISYGFTGKEEKLRKSALIDTRSEEVFIPKTKFVELVGNDKTQYTDLLVTKKLTQVTSRSFIFSREMMNVFRMNCKNDIYINLINCLNWFGARELFVIDTESIGLISLNTLPLSFRYSSKGADTVGSLVLPLDRPALIPEDAYDVVDRIIQNMNIVLEQLVPGLTIDIVELGTALLKDGRIGKQIQIMSLKNSRPIPFCYESEGIKKIVSILQLLIAVYNNASITVAVDELDGGIFEYLLGELLNIISEKGKGQLIFTSHNLRPLETIDRGFVAFTTTNPKMRYIRMGNVKDTNNLRDFYYRDIVLGEQNEQVYNHTNNFEIALAFREAGEAIGS